MAILGIDLGTSNSLVGVVQSGFPLLLADTEGRRVLPSVIHQDRDGKVLSGAEALRSHGANPLRSIRSAKRLMGRRWGEVGVDEWPQAQQRGAENEPCSLSIDDSRWLPEEVAAELLKALVQIAEERLEEKVEQAVITVPAYFNHAQREATRRAGELAGLEVVRMINEPTAAAMAYRADRRGAELVLVFDWGGGTFDASVLALRDGVYEVKATRGDTALGGDDLDQALAEFLLSQSAGAPRLDQLEAAARSRILDEACRAKERLSSEESITISLPFLGPDWHVEAEVLSADLAQLLKPLNARMGRCVDQVLADAGVAADELDEVLLVGGSTRIPALREFVADKLGQAPNTSQHPDEAVAMGAVIQAGVIEGSLQDLVLLDVLPLSLGLETVGGLMNVLLTRNTTIPAKAGEVFTNAVSGQRGMLVRVLQGEREMARDNWELGRIEVPFESAPRGSARVGVQFEVDENGLLTVLSRNLSTNEDTVLSIDRSAVDVNDEAVQDMVASSVDHAFADFSERVWAEAALKARELISSLDEALGQVEMVGDEAEQIGNARRRVESLLDGESRDGQELKAAVRGLDETTEVLAARLLEKVMRETSS